MPLPCSICQHDRRGEIDRALVEGAPIPELTARYRASPDALLRHKHRHLPLRLIKAQEAREASDADRLLEAVKGLRGKAIQLLMAAEQAGDLRTALMGVREARGCIELLAKLQGQLDERPVINLTVIPEFVEARVVLLRALLPYPEARTAAAEALLALEGPGGRRN